VPTQGLANAIRHLSIGALVEKIAMFASGLLLLGLLPLDEYGALALAYGTYTIVNLVAGWGMGDLVVARHAQAHAVATTAGTTTDEDSRLLGSFLFWVFAGVGIVAMIAVVLRPVIVSAVPTLADHYWLVLAAGLTMPLRNLVITVLRARHDFAGIKETDIVRSVGLTAGYALFIGGFGWGLAGGLLASLCANLLPVAWRATALTAQIAAIAADIRPRPMIDLVRAEGKWQLLRQAVTTTHASSRPWLINAILGIEAVGLFNAAKTVLALPGDLLPVKEALIPLMSREVRSAAALRTLYVQSLTFSTAIFGLLTVVVLLAAPWVFPLVFPRYAAAVPVIQIMSISILVAGLGTPQASLLYALRLQRAYSTTAILNFALMVCLGVPFMLLWGVNGFAAAFVVNSAVILWVRDRILIRACPELRLSWREWSRVFVPEAKLLKMLWSGR
jgi:O-antigen/teichoic acid export membrane protein